MAYVAPQSAPLLSQLVSVPAWSCLAHHVKQCTLNVRVPSMLSSSITTTTYPAPSFAHLGPASGRVVLRLVVTDGSWRGTAGVRCRHKTDEKQRSQTQS